MRLQHLIANVLAGAFLAGAGSAQADEARHVLLISIDGLHALDVANYVAKNPHSAMAELAARGVTYTNARTPANSDSFPGLLALVTGGSPVTGGVFYDVSYNRGYYANGDSGCSGIAQGTAAPAGPGSQIYFDESIDAYDTTAGPGKAVSKNAIDPAVLPYRRTEAGDCVPVYPHDALRTNTIFEVVRGHGGYTAWADKHPAYDLVNGPSGKGVDDLYTPEITNVDGFDATVSVVCTAANDQLKVEAILHEIGGRTHDGKHRAPVPTVFGMNFQAVSVGQKLAHDNRDLSCTTDHEFVGQPGGYLSGDGTPTPVLQYGLDRTDAALRSMIDALKTNGLYESTTIVVSAKHGQSPINPAKVNKPGHFADLVAGLVLTDAGELAAQAAVANAANCTNGPCGFVQDDDIALVWLQDASQTAAVASLFNKYAPQLFIDEVMAGESIKLKFNDPAHDSRTPDIIVQPQYGTTYTGSGKKNAEHGGFSFGDTNVGLIVSPTEGRARVVKTPVATSQVAVSILRRLGIDPQELHSVRVEHTEPLPGL
jgi:hypothetical protein